MKTYQLVILLVMAVIVGILLFKSQKEEADSPAAPRVEKTTLAGSSTTREGSTGEGEGAEKTKKPEDFTLEDIEKMNEIGRLSKEERESKPDNMSWASWTYGVFKHRSEIASNGNIEFYGKVIDEQGEPIKGVSLQAEITAYRTSLAEKIKTGKSSEKMNVKITTDATGRFLIKNKKGRRVMLSKFEKKGYDLIQQRGYKDHMGNSTWKRKYWVFYFNPQSGDLHHPDPNKPVEFVMKRAE